MAMTAPLLWQRMSSACRRNGQSKYFLMSLSEAPSGASEMCRVEVREACPRFLPGKVGEPDAKSRFRGSGHWVSYGPIECEVSTEQPREWSSR